MKIDSIRIFSILGILGALLMFVGDMCFYGHFGSAKDFFINLPTVISRESNTQIIIGGFIGPIAILLYCLGFYSVYKMIAQKSQLFACLVAASFVSMIVFGGVYHAMWGIRALWIHFGVSSSDMQAVYNKITQYTLLFYRATLFIGAIGALSLLLAVLTKRSLFPQWTVFINPGILFSFFLYTPLVSLIPGPFGAIIFGGYFNLVFIVFFSVTFSTAKRMITHGA